MQNDDDLRERFRALANEESTSAPVFTRVPVPRQRQFVWYSPGVLAVASGAVICALVTMTIGMVWGANTGYASARIEGERERSVLAANTLGVTRQLAGLRVDLAHTRAELSQLAGGSGTPSRSSLLAAEGELKGMEASIARIELDLTQANSPLQPAALEGIPMKRALALTCSALALGGSAAPAQQGIPIVNLPLASVRTASTFGAILGIKEVGDGRLLVNDAGRRQLKLYDTALVSFTTVRDSAPGNSNSYGPRPSPLISYLGDSTLIGDWNARTMLVLDGRGQVARALALPAAADFGLVNNAYTAVDNKGRVIFRRARKGLRGNTRTMEFSYSDSIVIARADLDSRSVDTVGILSRPVMKLTTEKNSDGKMSIIFALDPLQPVDDWAVLSTGAVAFLRGHDYHIDFVADTTTIASDKLPIDWKRIADGDKTRLADSVRAAQNLLLADGYTSAEILLRTPCDPPPDNVDMTRNGRSGGGGGSPVAPSPAADRSGCIQFSSNMSAPFASPWPKELRAPLADLSRVGPIADYYPPITVGSTMSDADGNVWILPRVTTLSQKGELVYDVVNSKGVMVERVRVPLGRAIAGFGKGGVVYLTSGDRTNGFYLERTRLKAPSK